VNADVFEAARHFRAAPMLDITCAKTYSKHSLGSHRLALGKTLMVIVFHVLICLSFFAHPAVGIPTCDDCVLLQADRWHSALLEWP